MTNVHSGTGQMAVCCQNLLLVRSVAALSAPVAALFTKFGLFLNTPHILDTKPKQNNNVPFLHK
jgi:hypothetical protein